jgi:DNA (cytosine-5)-methyltransferase 1
MEKINASVVDLFCGAGGLSHGFHLENFPVAAGIDLDEACRFPFEENNFAPFICKDVGSLTSEEVCGLFKADGRRILVGCAPCQPFSTYNQKNNDPNWRLLSEFGQLVQRVLPDIVSMENVPRLLKFRNGEVFESFLDILKACEYQVAYGVLYGPDFGLPQTRSRLVLLASRLGPIELPEPTHKSRHRSVREAIGNLNPIQAGGFDAKDPLHRSSRLSKQNQTRMKSTKPGGTWRDWEPELVVKCHTAETGRGYSSVYGRMKWDEPSPTVTTQFFGFGNGRFGHPEQDRALSLREGAILQSFPSDYKFVAPDQPVHFKKIGRMIGNAVPVELGRAIARSVKSHLETTVQ